MLSHIGVIGKNQNEYINSSSWCKFNITKYIITKTYLDLVERFFYLDELKWPWFLAAILKLPGFLLVSESLPLLVLLHCFGKSWWKTTKKWSVTAPSIDRLYTSRRQQRQWEIWNARWQQTYQVNFHCLRSSEHAHITENNGFYLVSLLPLSITKVSHWLHRTFQRTSMQGSGPNLIALLTVSKQSVLTVAGNSVLT